MDLNKRIDLLEKRLRPELHRLTPTERLRLEEITHLKMEFSDPSFPRAEYMRLVGKVISPKQHVKAVLEAWKG